MIARLNHPNFVQIHDYGICRESPYLVLEYVEGGTLAEQTAGVPQPERQAAMWVETLATAMHHAHGLQLIHRDIKPANILITSHGVLKIGDFGLVKHLPDGRPMIPDDYTATHPGSLVGTPSYMAPELFSGTAAAVDHRVDVYALGIILFELLTGQVPFRGNDLWELMNAVKGREPLPPRRLRPALSRDLETVCLKCIEKDPGLDTRVPWSWPTTCVAFAAICRSWLARLAGTKKRHDAVGEIRWPRS